MAKKNKEPPALNVRREKTSMDYEEALSFIHSTYMFGEKIGLELVTTLLSYLGDPHKGLKFVHIAGTNGKGSTSTMTATILRESGYRTGLYISPYLEDFRERIQMDNRMISREDLAETAGVVRDAIERMTADGHKYPSEFEVVTAIAFLYYRNQGADVVVLEVGMGGRMDATNVIETNEAAAIASISFDHMQYLGDTLAQIAFEKAGIIKEGCDVSVYCGIPDDVFAVIDGVARERSARVHRNMASDIELIKSDLDGQTILYKRADSLLGLGEFRLALLGRHQVSNVLNVLTVCEILKGKGYAITADAIRRALSGVKFTGRFEILNRDPVIVIDGGHNIEGVTSFVDNVKTYLPGRKICLFFGMLQDKQVDESLDLLMSVASRMYTLTPEDKRAVPAQRMAQLISLKDPAMPVKALGGMEDIGDEIDFGAKDEIYAFTGSLYMIGSARTRLCSLIASRA